MRSVYFSIVAAGLVGCASQSTTLSNLDSAINQALGQPISTYIQALGSTELVENQGELTRYRWRQADLVQPCGFDLFVNAEGIVRRSQWTGYELSCAPIEASLKQANLF